jgi:hypothetical protein
MAHAEPHISTAAGTRRALNRGISSNKPKEPSGEPAERTTAAGLTLSGRARTAGGRFDRHHSGLARRRLSCRAGPYGDHTATVVSSAARRADGAA